MQPSTPATPPQPVANGIEPIYLLIGGAVLFILLVGFVLFMRWHAKR